MSSNISIEHTYIMPVSSSTHPPLPPLLLGGGVGLSGHGSVIVIVTPVHPPLPPAQLCVTVVYVVNECDMVEAVQSGQVVAV
jgi:hypothetical protein